MTVHLTRFFVQKNTTAGDEKLDTYRRTASTIHSFRVPHSKENTPTNRQGDAHLIPISRPAFENVAASRQEKTKKTPSKRHPRVKNKSENKICPVNGPAQFTSIHVSEPTTSNAFPTSHIPPVFRLSYPLRLS